MCWLSGQVRVLGSESWIDEYASSLVIGCASSFVSAVVFGERKQRHDDRRTTFSSPTVLWNVIWHAFGAKVAHGVVHPECFVCHQSCLEERAFAMSDARSSRMSVIWIECSCFSDDVVPIATEFVPTSVEIKYHTRDLRAFSFSSLREGERGVGMCGNTSECTLSDLVRSSVLHPKGLAAVGHNIAGGIRRVGRDAASAAAAGGGRDSRCSGLEGEVAGRRSLSSRGRGCGAPAYAKATSTRGLSVSTFGSDRWQDGRGSKVSAPVQTLAAQISERPRMESSLDRIRQRGQFCWGDCAQWRQCWADECSCGQGGLFEELCTRKLWAVRRVNAVKKQLSRGAASVQGWKAATTSRSASSRAHVSTGTDT